MIKHGVSPVGAASDICGRASSRPVRAIMRRLATNLVAAGDDMPVAKLGYRPMD
jgi:hypothetical protein